MIQGRKYWESGCLCILTGRIEKAPENLDDESACGYYYNNCICTRSDGHQVDYKADAEMLAEWLLMKGSV
jgi:hypothetical protein